jgi:hypothetical protein
MTNLVNNTARLIIIAGKMYIPRKPAKVADLEKLKSKYPEISAMIKSGQLLVKCEREAKEIEAEYEKMKVDELKAYAKAHGIKLNGTNKKESILEAIKKAESEKWAKKG